MLKNIRACFGIKSSALVSYLQCSADMVNSIVSGRRTPNLNQLQEIINLHTVLEWDSPVDKLEHISQFLEQERAEAQQLMEAVREKYALELLSKKKKLAALQNKRQAWLRGLHACYQLLQTDLGPDKRKWVALRHKHLVQKLKEQSLFKQWVLEGEIRQKESQLV